MKEVVETFQRQIKDLKEFIMCLVNVSVQDESMKEEIVKKMKQMNGMEMEKDDLDEEETKKKNKKQTYHQRNQEERNEEINEIDENNKKKMKMTGHPILKKNVTGDVTTKMEWYNKRKQSNEKMNQVVKENQNQNE